MSPSLQCLSTALLRNTVVRRMPLLSGCCVSGGDAVSSSSFLRRQQQHRSYSSGVVTALPMKAGTPIPGLDFMKAGGAVTAQDRSDYPEWVNDLTHDMISLAALRKMDNEDATLTQMKRFLKLNRRNQLKDSNIDSGNK